MRGCSKSVQGWLVAKSSCAASVASLFTLNLLLSGQAAAPPAAPGTTSASPAASQNSTPPTTVIRSEVREVVLDVIVRQKNLALAKKLKASDFTVYEDGVPQEIRSFRFVGGRDAYLAADAAQKTNTVAKIAEAQANSTREPNFISIVFDQVSAADLDAAKNAINAANDFIDAQLPQNSYAAILRMNFRLNAVEGFTNDRERLRRAIVEAVKGNSSHLANASAAVLNQTTFTTSAGPGGITTTPTTDLATMPDLATGGAASPNPYSEGQQALAQMISDQRYDVSYVAGMATWDAFENMIRSEARLPGRKTVLYLSQGLVKPPDQYERIKRIIGEANRANITFYCIDIKGLIPASSNGFTNGMLNSAAALSRGQPGTVTTPAQMHQDDTLGLMFASHYQLNMDELATSTGGFAIFNTSDFKKNMARIMEDVSTHYEVSYVPKSTLYDGRFRQIKVEVKDPRLTVQSRDGYFALPEIRGWQVQPFETQAMRAMDGKRHDFDFSSRAFRFRPTNDGFRYEMGFEVRTENLATPIDTATHRARLHATFLCLLKDKNGEVVDHVSEDVNRDVPADKLEQFRNGSIIFTSPFKAAAGYYTLDVAVVDPEGNRAATKRIALAVPQPGTPAVSSIQVVREILPLNEPRDPGNPQEFDGGKIAPSIRQSSRADQDASLFFVVYPKQNGERASDRPRVTVTVLHDGEEVLRATPDVGTLDEVNTFPMIQRLHLPAGRYVATVSVEQAGLVSRESLPLQIEP